MITRDDIARHGDVTRRGSARYRAWRALDGASRAVLPAFGIGTVIGLVAGVPVLISGGAGALIGMTLGAIAAAR